MAGHEETDTEQGICPESTIDSAVRRRSTLRNVDSPGNYTELQDTGSKNGKTSKKNTSCESTIGSALRRDFIKKAAIVTVTAAVGVSILGKNIIPESTAFSCTSFCNINVDHAGGNSGAALRPGIQFGGCISGEGISSERTCTSASDYQGLDFWTNNKKRVTIAHNGNVGILTDSPRSTLDVNGCICVCRISAFSPCGLAVEGTTTFSGTGVYGQAIYSCLTCEIGGYGTGVKGCSISGTGVCGTSVSSFGIRANTGSPLIGKFKNTGMYGYDRTALIQFETGDTTVVDWNIGVAGYCNSLGIADGDFYIQQVGPGARLVISSSGNVGIGTASPCSTLEVKGNAVCSTIHGISCVGRAILGQSSSTSGRGVEGLATATSGTTLGVFGKACSPCSVGVQGCACAASGPTLGVAGYARSTCGIGVKGNAWAVSGHNVGVLGLSCSPCGISVEGLAGNAGTIPIVAKGASGQTAHLQEWRKSCGTAVAVLTKGGAFGIGNNAPVTSLTVNGSVSYKVEIKSANYTMQAYDYAVLGSATSTAGITITLPAAKTALGFLAFIKKVDSNPHAVTVAASGTDTIENKGSTIALNKQYDSLQLMSNGANEWFILGGSVCGAYVS